MWFKLTSMQLVYNTMPILFSDKTIGLFGKDCLDENTVNKWAEILIQAAVYMVVNVIPGRNLN